MTKADHRPLELWDVDKLVPYAKNAKKHPQEQIEKLATAIKEFGWTQPIVIDGEGVVIIGHGRRLAALHLGLKRVLVDVRRDLSADQVDALRLSDNRVTSTEYDMALIQEELQRLSEMDFDLSVIGFDDREIEFSTDDLGDMADDLFTDDISGAVEEQNRQNERAVEEADDTAAPLADAFGFKRVTIAQSRHLRGLVTEIEQRTGEKGVDAIIIALERFAR